MPSMCRWLLLGAAFGAPALGAQVHVAADSFYATTLSRRVRYHVVLPVSYDSTRLYPVLWLLHGHSGDDTDWLRLTRLTQYVARYPLIVVLPSVGNSFYVNSWADSTARYEDFIIAELHARITRTYAVDTLREAVAGLSMGGYGALMLGLRYPRRFRFAGILSGAIQAAGAPERLDTLTAAWTFPAVDSAFGPQGSAHRTTHDPFLLYRTAAPTDLPYLYFLIGTGDQLLSLLPLNRAFTDSLRAYGARYEYHEIPGGHSWRVWNAALPSLLARLWIEVTAPREVVKD